MFGTKRLESPLVRGQGLIQSLGGKFSYESISKNIRSKTGEMPRFVFSFIVIVFFQLCFWGRGRRLNSWGVGGGGGGGKIEIP